MEGIHFLLPKKASQKVGTRIEKRLSILRGTYSSLGRVVLAERYTRVRAA
jgi:hypothetical protein